MAVLKCKMCGGNIEVCDGMTIFECEYCGTRQTAPDDKDEVFAENIKYESENGPVKESVDRASADSLLKRAFIFLEDGKWDDADEYAEKVLDIEPENARAYFVKLMLNAEIRSESELINAEKPFDEDENFAKICRYDKALGEKLKETCDIIRGRNETDRRQMIYNRACVMADSARTESEFLSAAAEFAKITGFEDAFGRENDCREKAQNAHQTAEKNREEFELKVESVAAVLKSGTGKEMRRIEAKIALLKKLYDEFDSAALRSGELKNLISALQEECNEMNEKLTAVGIFRKKEKAELAENLIRAKNKIAACEKEAAETAKLYSGYETKESILKESEIAQAELAKLRESENTSLSYAKAYEMINSDPALADAVVERYPELPSAIPIAGRTFSFGKYIQNGRAKKPIEWLVLETNGKTAVLISKYALFCRPYNEKSVNATWETCSLRKWLNGEFINRAFSEDEQARIATVKVSAAKNPKYSTYPGSAVNDKVYLLGLAEAEKYFATDELRKCIPTDHAKRQGAGSGKGEMTANGEPVCRWWLRSPGFYPFFSAMVYGDGAVSTHGDPVNTAGNAVRPVLQIILDF